MKYLGDTQDEKSIVPKNILPLIYGSGTNSAKMIDCIASGDYSFAVGSDAQAIGYVSIAMMGAIASGINSLAIGGRVGNRIPTTASGNYSSAIGFSALSSGQYSIALGYRPTASGQQSIAIGSLTEANADRAMTFGYATKASSQYQTVLGRWNIEDDQDTYCLIIGNGTNQERSNAITIDWNGNISANNIITKNSFNNAGINNKTYVTEVEETTVTTESTELHPSYYAYVDVEKSNEFNRGAMYRITLDGTEYILPALRWFWSGSDGSTFWSKGVTFIGNLSLFCDASGFYDTLPDVPFVITNIYSLIPLVNEKIFLFTESAGSHTVKIERIDYDLTKIPTSLIWGNEISPIYEKIGDGGTVYTGICIGVNDMKNRKSTVAIGFNNTINGQAGIILGNDCSVTGQAAIAVGNRNEASGAFASAFGYLSKASGSYAESHGYDSTSSGTVSTTHGYRTISNHRSQFVFGEYNVADDSSAAATAKGNYVEIVGNGAKNAPSNARTLDWNGNESLAGGITLGKGTADEVTLTATQLKQLKQLINV